MEKASLPGVLIVFAVFFWFIGYRAFAEVAAGMSVVISALWLFKTFAKRREGK